MALVLADRVQETCLSPGTGSVSLLGAVTGYQSFSNAIGNGNTCYYTIADQTGANWEVGIGTYSSSGNVLARTTVLSSSNSGSLTNFSSGTQNIFVTLPSERVGTTQIGDVALASSAPTGPGTWLETGKYYSKSTYPDLAAAIGDVADFGTPVSIPQAQLPQTFAANTNTYSPYITATNGTVTVAVGQSGALLKTTDGSNWVGVPSTTTNTFNEVRYINSNFVAVGNSGTIVTSTDGSTWVARAVPTSNNLNSIAYGNGKYVAVSPSIITINSIAYGLILYSDDLITWTLVPNIATGTGIFSNRIIYANNMFIITCKYGVIYRSSDGITWYSAVVGTSSQHLYDVIYANSLFVAVGASNAVFTSSDGVTWTSRSATGSFNNVIYANSLFVAVGNSGVIYTSVDGVTWESRTSGAAQSLYAVTWNSTNYVAVGANGVYCTSPDGTTWTPSFDVSADNFYSVAVINSKTISFGTASSVILAGATRAEVLQNGTWNYAVAAQSASNPRTIAYNGTNLYVAAGSNGALLSSPDGQTWTGRYSGLTTNFDKVQYVNDDFIAMGGTGSSTNLLTSTDGITWTARTAGSGIFNAAAFGASTYVVVGASGAIYSSTPDTASWTSRSAGASTFNDVIFANSIFVAVGASNSVYSSPDGVTWTLRTATGTFNRVIYANSLFVAIGNSGAIYTSADGITWTSRTSGVAGTLNDVVWNGSIFCAVGASGVITTSSDGLTWTARTPGDTTVTLLSISWNGTRFVVTNSTNGVAWVSTDGITWTRASTVYQGTTLYSCYLGGKHLAIGTGFIQTSTDGINWTNCDHVQYVPTTLNKIYKLGGIYYALTNKGVFQSSDGVTFALSSRSFPSGNVLSMAYSGTSWIAVSTSVSGQPQAFYKSTDGTTWAKSVNLGTLTRTSTLSGSVVDLIYANGNFVCGQVSSTAQLLPFTIYTSTDGLTWTGRQTPFNAIPAFLMASDGSNIVTNSTSYGCIKSSDGGITWSILNMALNPVYSNGVWLFQSSGMLYTSTDLSTFNGFPLPSEPANTYVSGNFISFLNYAGKYYLNKKTNGIASSPLNGSVIPASTINKEAVTRNTNVLVAISASKAINPNLIVEFPLYSYDTSTTFWIPPSNAGVGQVPYIYAGA